ncbi:MAG: MFS transporter, partial [Pseudomonadota bacterium]
MGYLKLLISHKRTIGFGFLNSFFSGLGQTHFISVFSPFIMAQYALNHSQYGSLYSLITLLSGFTIIFLGPLIDRYDLRYFCLFIAAGLVLSELAMMSHLGVVSLGVGLFGLRLFGQGLCSSIGSISIARYFSGERGKALSLCQMGFPAYEGLITPLGAFLMAQAQFHTVAILLMIAVLVIYVPFTFFMTREIPDFNLPNEVATNKQPGTPSESMQKSWTRKEVFLSPTIYTLLPQTLMPPFALTGVFFHQAAFADQKGWTLSLMASGLFFFAIGRVINTFLTGPLVDKHSAVSLFPYYQFPMAAGFFAMGWGDQSFIPALCFALCGLTVGSGGPIKSAIWAELYGIKHLGAIKSSLATLMVFSTAASPALFGWLIESGFSMKFMFGTLGL